MSDEPELKPCPFCGGEAKATEKRFGVPRRWQMLWGVYCDGDCGTFFDCREPSKSSAVTAWNTRTDEATRPLVEALEKIFRGDVSGPDEDGEFCDGPLAAIARQALAQHTGAQ